MKLKLWPGAHPALMALSIDSKTCHSGSADSIAASSDWSGTSVALSSLVLEPFFFFFFFLFFGFGGGILT